VFKRRASSPKALSVKHGRTARGIGCFAIPFFGLFFVVGSIFFYLLTIRPISGVVTSGNWVETPCTITHSELDVHSDSDGTSYAIDIQYDYVFAGRNYHSDRYHFMGRFSSSGRSSKQKVVDHYAVGQPAVCYVDPDHPDQAVLNRGFTLDMLWGLFPLPFLLIGSGGLLYTAGVFGKKSTEPAGGGDFRSGRGAGVLAASGGWSAGESSDAPVVLKPDVSPRAKLLGFLLIALFWNGITSIFVYHAVQSFMRGNPQWGLALFISPFVLIGCVLVLGVVHSFVALFNPRPTLLLGRPQIPLGGSERLTWRFSGNTSSIRHLRITLSGQERATYRRGTDTIRDDETFFERVLFESRDPFDIAEGETEIQIPADSMHSFSADNNAIVWSIQLLGEITLRPDVSSEFPIRVVPHERHVD
jgi:hypothetical protein